MISFRFAKGKEKVARGEGKKFLQTAAARTRGQSVQAPPAQQTTKR
jgi:hypothetical protein